MVWHLVLQWTTPCQTSPPWPDHLGWPHTAWLSFIELDKAVVLWSDWLVFCDYGFSLSALWCPLSVPTVLPRFLLPWTWGISSRLLQQSTATAPYLGWVCLLKATPPDLERGEAPLGPPAPAQPWLLGCGVALLGHCRWPWAWGIGLGACSACSILIPKTNNLTPIIHSIFGHKLMSLYFLLSYLHIQPST